MDSINIKSSDYNRELIKVESHPQNDEINVNDNSVDNNINCVGGKPFKCSSSREELQSDGLDCCRNVVSIKTGTESDWVEKRCKSGELLYHYNKVSGEKQWPSGGAHRVSDVSMFYIYNRHIQYIHIHDNENDNSLFSTRIINY